MTDTRFNLRRNTPGRCRPCRHCFLVRYPHARGLCRTCHETPAIRRMYPTFRPTGPNGLKHGTLPQAPEPTLAMPGSLEKVAVMEARVGAGFACFHELDARWEDDES